MWLKIIGLVCAGAFVSAAVREMRGGHHRKKHEPEPKGVDDEGDTQNAASAECVDQSPTAVVSPEPDAPQGA